jgi:hypothetical protein
MLVLVLVLMLVLMLVLVLVLMLVLMLVLVLGLVMDVDMDMGMQEVSSHCLLQDQLIQEFKRAARTAKKRIFEEIKAEERSQQPIL